jgi:hypothetical protein
MECSRGLLMECGQANAWFAFARLFPVQGVILDSNAVAYQLGQAMWPILEVRRR